MFYFKKRKEKFFKLNMMLADVVFIPRAVASWIQNPRQGWIYMYLKYKKWTKFNQHLSHLLKSKTTILHLSKVNLNPGKRSHYHRWAITHQCSSGAALYPAHCVNVEQSIVTKAFVLIKTTRLSTPIYSVQSGSQITTPNQNTLNNSLTHMCRCGHTCGQNTPNLFSFIT